MSDLKIKTAAGKPPLGVIPTGALVGPARVFQYGGRKYTLGNYYQATLDDGAGERYISAAFRHASGMQLPNGTYSPESLAALDDESGLPHIDHWICGLLMLRSIMVKCGALPVDPGIGNDPTALRAVPLDPRAPTGPELARARAAVTVTTAVRPPNPVDIARIRTAVTICDDDDALGFGPECFGGDGYPSAHSASCNCTECVSA